MSRVVFRVDASEQMGGGHLLRCIALADALSQRGAEIHFICGLLPGHFSDLLEKSGLAVIQIKKGAGEPLNELVETQAALESLGVVDWLVIDHYGLDEQWETKFRRLVRKIMVIDDKANRRHNCDILLDQNYIPSPVERYNDLVPASCQMLLGPRYAILQEGFSTARQNLRLRDGQVRRLLICFGATDPAGHTFSAIEALFPNAGAFEQIDVVTTPENSRATELQERCSELPNVYFHSPAKDFIGLMQAADLAVGAGGIMNWERACLGIPTIAFGIADNQEPILASLIHDGIVLGEASMPNPDSELMSSWLSVVACNPELLRGLSARSLLLVDGRGAQRVAEVLIPALIRFRPATLKDSRNLFAWRNSADVSSASASGIVPDYFGHEIWLKETLANENSILLVIEEQQEPVGVVRFDCNGNEATISIYRIPGSRESHGLIRQSTEWLRFNRRDLRRIVANILPGNDVSLAAFRAAGYDDKKHTLFIDL